MPVFCWNSSRAHFSSVPYPCQFRTRNSLFWETAAGAAPAHSTAAAVAAKAARRVIAKMVIEFLPEQMAQASIAEGRRCANWRSAGEQCLHFGQGRGSRGGTKPGGGKRPAGGGKAGGFLDGEAARQRISQAAIEAITGGHGVDGLYPECR